MVNIIIMNTFLNLLSPLAYEDYGMALDSDWNSSSLAQARELLNPTQFETFDNEDKTEGYLRFTFESTQDLPNDTIHGLTKLIDENLLYRDDCDPLEPNHWYIEKSHDIHGNFLKTTFTVLKAYCS